MCDNLQSAGVCVGSARLHVVSVGSQYSSNVWSTVSFQSIVHSNWLLPSFLVIDCRNDVIHVLIESLNFWVHHGRLVCCKIIKETQSTYFPHFWFVCKGVVIWRVLVMLGWWYVRMMYSDSISFEFHTWRRVYSQSSECIQVPCISSLRVELVLLLIMLVVALR